jgi:hypothetical protein
MLSSMTTEKDNHPLDSGSETTKDEEWMEQMLRDPTRKAILLQKLALEDPPSQVSEPSKGKTPANSGGKSGAW